MSVHGRRISSKTGNITHITAEAGTAPDGDIFLTITDTGTGHGIVNFRFSPVEASRLAAELTPVPPRVKNGKSRK